jgi:phospholipid/cholesterol/gamma-HCH transport system substrate-binding protein
VSKIELFSDKASGLVDEFNAMAGRVNDDFQNGPGTVHSLLTDSTLANRLSLSLYNIERGTEAFDQDMEALKHNFLLRRYFRRSEKKQRDSVK